MDSPSDRQTDIKEFIVHIHRQLDILSRVMHESKQDYEQIRNESRIIETNNQEANNDITNRILDDVEKLEKEFKSLVSEEKSEISFLKQQITALNQEKMKLEQNILLLGTRVEEVERNIGIELSLPSIERAK
ncbi:hypothetical protein SteCoe_689 [Stentor coeruleus]|uniref:Uncharacterized protein n=1 Tax=Stentor coeruleus TaxID=5963 RepID=A0A1R2D3F4_9CILI|nr:hypothetical protein SteCoe_689 [Stentor coeruleus]